MRLLAFVLASMVVGASARAQSVSALLSRTHELVAAAVVVQPAPTNVAAVDAGQGRASVTWTDNSGGTAQFEVQRAPAFASMVIVGPGGVGVLDDPGNGAFQYRVRAFASTTTSAWTPWAPVTITSGTAGTNNGAPPSEGWTGYTPSADTRIVYVSSSEGSDANTGLAPGAPVRTLAAGYAKLRHGMPDWLLLKRGDAWDETFGHWRKSGRSLLEPMVIATYGTNPERPLLRTGAESAFTRSGGGGSPLRIDNISLMGIHMQATPRTPEACAAGVFWVDAGSNILVEDCRIEGYSFNISIQGSAAARVSNVRIRRNVIVDAYLTTFHSSGLFMADCDGVVIEENVFDHNGWKAGVAAPNMFNHNIYIYQNCGAVMLVGNILSDAASHGAQLRSGGSAVDNLFVSNPIALLLARDLREVRGNVVLDGRNIDAANPRGFGVDLDSASNGGRFSDNIIAHGHGGLPHSVEVAESVGGTFGVVMSGNIVYNWGGPWFFQGTQAQLNNIVFSNNTIQENTTTSLLIEHLSSPVPGQVLGRSNTYAREGRGDDWFRAGSTRCGLAAYRPFVGDTSSQSRRVQFVDPERSCATYNASLGGLPTFDDFITQARRQSRWNWRPEYTARAVNRYIRAGFASR